MSSFLLDKPFVGDTIDSSVQVYAIQRLQLFYIVRENMAAYQKCVTLFKFFQIQKKLSEHEHFSPSWQTPQSSLK